MTYQTPLAEISFILREIIGAEKLADSTIFKDATPEMTGAILTEAARLADQVLAPLQRSGDLHPAKLNNGKVLTSPGFAEGYQAIASGGWVGICAPPTQGGLGLPLTLATAVGEMLAGACLSLSLNPLMSQGQIEALAHHASDEIKAIYLPKLISGQWTGTMNLTEPQAGSDVGALRSRAIDNGDGTFAIDGQKIFISWGDHDMAENICHLVLARLPDAPSGTKSISLFMVPKFLPDADGNPQAANTLKVVSLEHKLGLHGSPTAVMAFEGATGWMVGKPGGGMAAMFTMMNNARLGVGIEGLGVAQAATQKAMAYAMERTQGRPPIEGGTGTIIDHADVRSMLLAMKSLTTVARAICYDTAFSTDMAKADGDKKWAARAAFLTPIAKAFGTDIGSEVADLGVQVHGGTGVIEETGAAQYLRDVRVTRIYEGTNGIQAMDLVGRKLQDDGAAAYALLGEIEHTSKQATTSMPALATALDDASQTMRATIKSLLAASDLNDRFAGSTKFLRAFALTLGAHYLLKAALAEGENGPRTALASYFIRHQLCAVSALCASATTGAADFYAISAQDLAL